MDKKFLAVAYGQTEISGQYLVTKIFGHGVISFTEIMV